MSKPIDFINLFFNDLCEVNIADAFVYGALVALANQQKTHPVVCTSYSELEQITRLSRPTIAAAFKRLQPYVSDQYIIKPMPKGTAFAQINPYMLDKGWTHKELIIWASILYHTHSSGKLYAAYETIAGWSHAKRDTVKYTIQHLKQAGLLRFIKRDKVTHIATYRVNKNPEATPTINAVVNDNMPADDWRKMRKQRRSN